MIDHLDRTIKALLEQELPQVGSGQVEVSFEQPSRKWSGDHRPKPTLNFFLYDVRDNPILRQHQWQTIGDSRNGMSAGDEKKTVVQKRTPMRVDCFYLVTAWSADADPTKRPQAEHRLLSECLMALARYPILNRPDAETLLLGQRLNRTNGRQPNGQPGVAPQSTNNGLPGQTTETGPIGEEGSDEENEDHRDDAQSEEDIETDERDEPPCTVHPFLKGDLCTDEYEIPTRLAYHDVMTNPAELWGSLDNDIRAGFSFVVNLPLDPWRYIAIETGEVGGITVLGTPPQRGEPGKDIEPVGLDPREHKLPPTLVGGLVKKVVKQKQPQVDGRDKEIEVEIAYANVEVWLPELGRSTKTDSKGRFVFRRLPKGTYRVEIREEQDKPALVQGSVTIAEDLKGQASSIVLTVPLPKTTGSST